MTLQQLDALRDQLKNEMSGSSPNLQKVGQLLTQAKVKITNLVSLLYFVLNTF
jgi:26S proteasome regulatory subunit N12